jgi:hypothetical protein
MHLKYSLILNAPRERAWRAFENTDNLRRWQSTLVSYEQLTGTPGEPGATARLTYDEAGRRIELKKTVNTRREPEESQATYDSVHGSKSLQNRFIAIDDERTRWDLEAVLTLKGAARLMASLLRGTLEQRLRTDADRFKALLEAGELEA